MDKKKDQAVKKCPECGGNFEKKIITYDERWGKTLYTFTEVPVWVCEACGEEYFEGKVLEEMERIIQTHLSPEKYIKVPVFSFSKFAQSLNPEKERLGVS